MSIEQVDVVDAVGVDNESGKVILTISDHLDWGDEQSHLLALQQKLNRYIQFIESGELVVAYPDATGRQPVIDVVGRVVPSPTGNRFFEHARPLLADAGIELRSRTLEGGAKPNGPAPS